MIQTKPSNIFDFFAPTGGAPKIADFTSKISNSASISSAAQPIIASATTAQSNLNNPANIPGNSKENNTWKWVLGVGIVAVIGYFIYDHFQEKNKKDKKNNLVKV